jgi:hypothetical protein
VPPVRIWLAGGERKNDEISKPMGRNHLCLGSHGIVRDRHCNNVSAKKLADCTPLEKAVRMYLREDAAEQLAAMVNAGLLAYQTLREYNLGDHRAAITLLDALSALEKE